MKTRFAPHKVRQKEITEWNILILDGGGVGWRWCLQTRFSEQVVSRDKKD